MYEVILVRHGLTDDNAKGIIQGWIDTPINAEGEIQADMTGRYFQRQGMHFDHVFTSDLGRCRKTTILIMAHQDDPVQPLTDWRIREKFLGSLQGKRFTSHQPPDVEPLPVFSGRLLDFWNSLFPPAGSERSHTLLKPHSSNGENGWVDTDEPIRILLVSHGGPIKVLIPTLLSLPNYSTSSDYQPAPRVGNCSITRVNVSKDDKGWKGIVQEYASLAHLSAGDRTAERGDAELAGK